LELLSFFGVPFAVKTMFLEGVLVIVYYMVSYIVKALEGVRAQFAYLSF